MNDYVYVFLFGIIAGLICGFGVGSILPYADGYVSFSQVPDEVMVGFDYKAIDITPIQQDYCISLKAYDDRGEYHKSYDPSIGPLSYANVTVIIFPYNDDTIITELEGKTSKQGYYADCTFITTHNYLSHGLYNMTMTVSYGESVISQETQFWTVQK